MKQAAKRAAAMLAAGVMLIAAVPATAKDNDREGKKDGISAGEVVAGAVVLGGLAAIVASSSSKKGRGDYDHDYDYDENYNGRSSVERCVRAAERRASRLGKAKVTEITMVDRIRRGYRVEGDIRVKERRGRDGAWREWGGSGQWDKHDRGGERQRGSFTCETRRGEIRRLDFDGLGSW